jgi:hypothetical protein
MSTYDCTDEGWPDPDTTSPMGYEVGQDELSADGTPLTDGWDVPVETPPDQTAVTEPGAGVSLTIGSDWQPIPELSTPQVVDTTGSGASLTIGSDWQPVPELSTPQVVDTTGSGASLTIGSPWEPLPDLTDPQVVDALAGPVAQDIPAILANGPAHTGASAELPVDGVDPATGLGHLDAAASNMAGLPPTGSTQVYDPSNGGTGYLEPGQTIPEPWPDPIVDGY